MTTPSAAPPRVLHVVVAGELGGAERMLADLARDEADGIRHEIALLTPSSSLREAFAGLVVHDGGTIRENPIATLSRFLLPKATHWIERVGRERKATVIHVHTFASQVPGTRAALRLALPCVRTEHSTRVFTDPSCLPFAKWSIARATSSVCVSEHVRSVAADVLPARDAAKIVVVNNGLDTARFDGAPRSPAPGALRLLALGRLEPRKGVDKLMRALAAVAATGSESETGITLDVVGDGESRAELELLAHHLGISKRVRFHGAVADVRGAIHACDALVAGSREEGLGLAMLEGMACSRPAYAVPVGGLVEFIDDAVGGLAHDTSVPALASLLRRIHDERALLPEKGRAARARVIHRYSLGAMLAGYRAVYRRASVSYMRT